MLVRPGSFLTRARRPTASGPLVYDTFTDTDGVSLSAHTPDVDSVGTGWEQYGALEASTFGLAINGNRAESERLTASCSVIDAGAADVIVTVDLTLHATESRWSNVVIRAGAVTDYYFVELKTNLFRIFELNAGSGSTKASTAVAYAQGETVQVVVTVNGSSIEAVLNGGEHSISYASAIHTSNTKHGIYEERSTAFADNFKIEAAA